MEKFIAKRKEKPTKKPGGKSTHHEAKEVTTTA
jgi:hypothetical protein